MVSFKNDTFTVEEGPASSDAEAMAMAFGLGEGQTSIVIRQKYDNRTDAEEAAQDFSEGNAMSVVVVGVDRREMTPSSSDVQRGIGWNVYVNTGLKTLDARVLRGIERSHGYKKRVVAGSVDYGTSDLIVYFSFDDSVTKDEILRRAGSRVNTEKLAVWGESMMQQMGQREGREEMEWKLGNIQKAGMDQVGSLLNNMEQLDEKVGADDVTLTYRKE